MALEMQLDDGFGGQGRLGLIVLSTDETLENEARSVVQGQSVSLLHARIPAQPDVTPAALATMAAHMTQTAGLLPRGLDVIGYGCTSGATVIGPDKVQALIREAHPGVAVTNPLSAVVAALSALEARRIALLTPYVASVNAPLIAALATEGIEVITQASFEESDDWTVARITEAATLDGVRALAKGVEFDAVFASCTNLRTFGMLDAAEAAVGVPMVSSNLALVWHMLQLAGIGARGWGPGRLFSL